MKRSHFHTMLAAVACLGMMVPPNALATVLDAGNHELANDDQSPAPDSRNLDTLPSCRTIGPNGSSAG